MAFCKKCGAALEDGAGFCPACGTKQDETAQQPQNNTNDGVQKFIDSLQDTPDYTSEYTSEDIEANKVFGIISYIYIGWIISLIVAKDSKFARFHVNQGVILGIAELLFTIFAGVFGFWLLRILFSLVDLACFALTIIGIINAANGRAKELPYIGKYRFFK